MPFAAAYDFEATQPDQLSVRQGDVVQVLDRGDDGWWTCRRGAREGLVPEAYLQETAAPAAPTGPACHRCGEPIVGEGVGALGPDMWFHPPCLRCHECDAVLEGRFQEVDLEDTDAGRVAMCAACFERASAAAGEPAPPCARCGAPLTTTGVRAAGAFWHTACLQCDECGELVDGPFRESGAAVLHPACFERRFGDACARCGASVRAGGGAGVGAFGKFFCAGCFICAGCGQPVARDSAFRSEPGEQEPWHADCFVQARARPCAACGEPITSTGVSTTGGLLHLDCFKCGRCSAALDASEDYHDIDGVPVCEPCKRSALSIADLASLRGSGGGAAPAAAAAAAAPAPAPGRQCGACGHAVSATARFCTGCGARQGEEAPPPAAPRPCAACGHENSATARFCSGCGASVRD